MNRYVYAATAVASDLLFDGIAKFDLQTNETKVVKFPRNYRGGKSGIRLRKYET